MHSIDSVRTIDCHAHARIEVDMGPQWPHGPEYGVDDKGQPWYRVGNYRLAGVKHTRSPFTDPQLRIEAMDAARIDFQILSPSPLTYFHFIERADAIDYCRKWNDALAKITEQHGDRLAGLATLPMQDPDGAARELSRAVNELGLVGGAIGTDFGTSMESSAVDALYAVACAEDVPLFVHGVPAGIDGPPGDPNLRRFDLDVVCGFAAQITTAVATVIYGGVLRRHPTLKICFSDGGGATPFLAGRMRQAALKRPWSPDWLREPGAFEKFLRMLWFDTNVGDAGALDLLVAAVGTDRLVMGTNFAGWDQQDSIKKGADLPMLADNARRLLSSNARKRKIGGTQRPVAGS